MITLTDLTLGYDKKPLFFLEGFHLPRGGQCLIQGASGSGKTTMLHAIAGLGDVQRGNININGTDITQLSETQRDRFRGRQVGIIFQTLHLVRSLTVLDNLLLAAYAANLPQKKDAALALLQKLGMEGKKHAYPHELSHGQAQRVAIARAVINKPCLILADEPTSSLDDANAAQVIALLQEIAQDNNACLIVSTHDARIKSHFTTVISL